MSQKPATVRRLVLYFPFHEGQYHHEKIFEAAHLALPDLSYVGVKTMESGSLLVAQRSGKKITVRKTRHALAQILDVPTHHVCSIVNHTDEDILAQKFWSFQSGLFHFGGTHRRATPRAPPSSR